MSWSPCLPGVSRGPLPFEIEVIKLIQVLFYHQINKCGHNQGSSHFSRVLWEGRWWLTVSYSLLASSSSELLTTLPMCDHPLPHIINNRYYSYKVFIRRRLYWRFRVMEGDSMIISGKKRKQTLCIPLHVIVWPFPTRKLFPFYLFLSFILSPFQPNSQSLLQRREICSPPLLSSGLIQRLHEQVCSSVGQSLWVPLWGSTEEPAWLCPSLLPATPISAGGGVG